MVGTTSTAFNDVEVIAEVRHCMGVNARYFPCAVGLFLEPLRRPTRRHNKVAPTEAVAASSALGASPGHYPSNRQVSCQSVVPANVAWSSIANPDHHHQLHLLGYAHWQQCASACQLNMLTCNPTGVMVCFSV